MLAEARRRVSIPVWHDDQQGTATAVLAGLITALEVVGKPLGGVRIVLFGVGAANVSTYRLLTAYGVDPKMIVASDTKGVLHPGRSDIEERQNTFADKWRICRESNGEGLGGAAEQAFKGADVCIAFSRPGPGVIQPEWIQAMARDAIVFACANPTPEIWPEAARAAGARVVASGRSDFPNQLNNSLVFPGLFRGVLDVRARTINRPHGDRRRRGTGGAGQTPRAEPRSHSAVDERSESRGERRRGARRRRRRGRVGAQSAGQDGHRTTGARRHPAQPRLA